MNCSDIPLTQDIFVFEDMDNDTRVCCGITKVQFGLIVGFSIFVFLLLIVLIWQRKRIINLCKRNQYYEIKNNKSVLITENKII